MKLFTQYYGKLLQNGKPEHTGIDHFPVVKFLYAGCGMHLAAFRVC